MRIILNLFVGISALCLIQASRAEEQIVVVVPAIFREAVHIDEGIKHSCAVDVSVGHQVLQHVSERFSRTDRIQDPGQVAADKLVLKVIIMDVRGVGGGGWSGSKSISVRAEVLRGAKVVRATFLARSSRGGVLGGVSGTCPIMNRIAVALGQDVAKWMHGEFLAGRPEAAAERPIIQPAKAEGGVPEKSAEEFKP